MEAVQQPASQGATEKSDGESCSPAVENKLVHPRDGLASYRFTAILVANILGSYVSGYDVSNLANIQAPVYEAFGNVQLLSWVAVSYSMANGALIPIVRKLAMFCELRLLAMLWLLIFFVGAVVCGSATTIHAVIVGRVLNGIGAAGVYQVNQYYNVIFCRPSELPLVQALIGLFWSLGIISGPLIGGAFADNTLTTWRWAFYINLPLCGLIVPTVFLLPTYSIATEIPLKAKLSSLDWAGGILHMATLCLFAIALLFSGPVWPWSSGAAIAIWVVLILISATYAAQQYFSVGVSRENRILPYSLLKRRIIILTTLGTAVSAATYAVTLYYTPLFFAFAHGHSPLAAAVRLLPLVTVFIVFVLLTGGTLPVFRRYAPYYLLAAVLTAVGGGLMTTINQTTPESHVMGFEALIGVAIGLGWQTALGVTSLVAATPSDRFDAAMLQSLAQLVPVAFSLSIAGCIFQNVGFSILQRSLAQFGVSDTEVRDSLAGVASGVWQGREVDQQMVKLVVEAVTEVIAKLFFMVLAAGVLGLVGACAMKWEALDFKRASNSRQRMAEVQRE